MVRSFVMGPPAISGNDLDEARALLSKIVDIQHALEEISAALVGISSHAACLVGVGTVHGLDTQAEGLQEFRDRTPEAAMRILEACPGLVDAATALARR